MLERLTPSGCYWRGDILWGRATIAGKEHRWSLRTGDAETARRRLDKLKQRAVGNPARPRPRQRTVIYFLGQRGFVKIGFSEAVERRIRDLQIASPQAFTLLFTMPGGLAQEAALHKRFRALRAHGEWFRLEGELLVFCQRRIGVTSPTLLACLGNDHGQT